MLKRISTSDVELGMFVHKLEGSWFKHPFWKTKFLLEDPAMLADLHASDVAGVIIDTARGLDLRPKPVRPVMAETAPATSAPIVRPERRRPLVSRSNEAPPIDLRSTTPHTTAREFGAAVRVAGQSRKLVSRIFLESRFGKTIKAAAVEPVIEDIFASVQRNPHAFNGLMRCKRDNEYVYRHALAVSALMISLARHMKMPPNTIREAGMAGLMMDVGIGHLPVDLTEYGGDYRNVDETILCQHVMLGHQFLSAGGDMPQSVLDVCHNHHEMMDGTGYPRGLKGNEIDVMSRMAAICDTYDSLVSDTAEGTGMDPASAVAQMNAMQGWFDPEIMQKFIETMGIYPIGSVVRLRSGRLAMVVGQSPSDITRPRVRTFLSVAERRFVKAEDIDLANCFGADEIEGSDDPAAYGVADWPKLRERLFTAAAKAG